MKKFILMTLCAGVCALAAAQTEFTVYAIKGPSGVALIDLFEKPPVIPGFTVKLEPLAQADQIAARLITGQANVGILPVNVAAKIAASGKGVQIAAIIGNGMLSLLTTDPRIKTIKDLKGATVSVAGQGAVPEFVFRSILNAAKLAPGVDVTLDFSLAYPEIAQSLIAGRIKTALLPEPFATLARLGSSEVKQVGNIQTEWAAASKQKSYPMTALVVNADFARQHSAALAALLDRAKESVAWVTANPAAAGALVEKHGFGLKAPVVAASVPNSNFVYQTAAEAKPALEALFKAFLAFEPASIGGKMPAAGFYWTPPKN